MSENDGNPAHRRPNGEISFDLVMDDDMGFVEGSYRIGGNEWCVFVFSKKPIEKPHWKICRWASGASGIVASVPLKTKLNVAAIESVLSEVLGVGLWKTVQGPDSIQLR